MPDTFRVTTVIGNSEVDAGTMYRTRASASFEYSREYLRRRDAFALAPALGLFPGPQPLAPQNPFSDSAPDTWGRKVQTRAAGRRLDELTLMLGVNDEGRQGATRFWSDGVALADGDGTPAEAELSEIIRTADQVQRGDARIDDLALRRLFRATGSLGGARPKANVRLGDGLWLAKFPKPLGDEWNVMAWEAATLDAMDALGIQTPPHMTKTVLVDGTGRTVLFVKRFDRSVDGQRIPYISAMTALEATDGDGGDWVDLVDVAQVNGADPTELWKRAIFGALVGNLDDHLRNHGFLRLRGSWVLSPVFDVNPEPLGEGDAHQLALLGDSNVSFSALMSSDALSLFGVDHASATGFVDNLRRVCPQLPELARVHGADHGSIEIMTARLDAAGAMVA